MVLSLNRGRPGSGILVLAVACFAAGVVAGAQLGADRLAAAAAPVVPAPPMGALRSGHPAEVLRVLDGDTFEARVRIWPGMDVTTKVRLRGIDAPEMHARCDAERVKAVAARDALTQMLKEGSVAVSTIGQDKYGGRVDAVASTAHTPDVAAALVERGLVRRYTGRKREGWCG